jgi:hypothetical protein
MDPWIYLVKPSVGHQHAVFQTENRLDQACHSCCTLSVSNIALYGANINWLIAIFPDSTKGIANS